MYETINSPVTLGGLTLKNRIIFAPTSMGLKEDELLAKMEAIAAGGCAIASKPAASVLYLGLVGWLLSKLFEKERGDGCSM